MQIYIYINTGCFDGRDLFQRMIRTFGLGPRAKNGVFRRLEWDLGPTSSANPRGSVKTRRWGKWPILDLFRVHGWPYRTKKGDHVLTIFPLFLAFFTFSHFTIPHNTHTIPHAFLSVSCGFQCFSTRTQHTTYTLTDTHTHTHANLPLTVILRVV